jgi:gamma-tubulin complex component 5
LQTERALGFFLCFSSQVPWPLDLLVLSAETLGEYNKVFTLLLQIRLAKHSVDRIGFASKTQRRQQSQSRFEHSFFILRCKLLHFVDNLQNYIVNRVLQTTWAEFEEMLRLPQNVQELAELHREYLVKIRDRCLLNPKAALVMKTIKKILNMCVQLKEQVRGSTSGGGESSAKPQWSKDHGKMHAEFDNCYAFLITILVKIISQKKLPHCK